MTVHPTAVVEDGAEIGEGSAGVAARPKGVLEDHEVRAGAVDHRFLETDHDRPAFA